MKKYQNKIDWFLKILKGNKRLRFSVYGLFLLLFVALFADFIANEKPFYCEIKGERYFPILKAYSVNFGFSNWNNQFLNAEWSNLDYQKVIFAPIPYSSQTLDIKNRGFVSPLASQNVKSWRFRHWLGTDAHGRDVTAGMVHGTRIALLVGIFSMLIATIIGLIFGSFAGFFGDSSLKLSRSQLLHFLVVFFSIFYFVFIAMRFELFQSLEKENYFATVLKTIAIILLIIIISKIIQKALYSVGFFRKEIIFPIDSFVMRIIEIMRSIPGLLLLLAIVSVLQSSSLFNVIVVVGLIRWTSIATFLRAELLKIRELEYIQAAKALGFSNLKILVKHALPNALPPVLITISFGIASAILLEAFLSFLGIGLSVEQVSWGSLLNNARQNFSAWWLAIFPGMGIFMAVIIFNIIGDEMIKVLD